VPSVRTRRALRAVAGGAVGLTLALTGVVGFAHTPAGRPLLKMLGMRGLAAGTCPLGYDHAATPEDREAASHRFASSHAGDTAAASRPAVGFDLDHTTRSDVQAWAYANGVTCAAAKGPYDLACSDVPGALLPAAYRGAGSATLWLTFGEGERLLEVSSLVRAPSAAPVSAAFAAVTSDVARAAGQAPTVTEDASAERLASSGSLYQATAEFRLRDYYAVARATHVRDGFVLTTDHRSLSL
jgi:hypothetical protein